MNGSGTTASPISRAVHQCDLSHCARLAVRIKQAIIGRDNPFQSVSLATIPCQRSAILSNHQIGATSPPRSVRSAGISIVTGNDETGATFLAGRVFFSVPIAFFSFGSFPRVLKEKVVGVLFHRAHSLHCMLYSDCSLYTFIEALFRSFSLYLSARPRSLRPKNFPSRNRFFIFLSMTIVSM